METLSASEWAFLRHLAVRIVPEVANLDARTGADFRAVVDEALSARPAAVRRQFRVLLGLLRWLPALRYRTSFERLSPRRQEAVLRWFQDGPIRPLRQGCWGVKTLVFMGFYGRPEVGASIGYMPSFAGNDKLHA